MAKTRTYQEVDRPDSNAFNLSISDLMAGVLSIFILAVCYFMLNLGEVKDQYTGNIEKRSQLLEEIQAEMTEKGILVKVDKEQGVLRIPEGALFAQGQADIKEDGQAVIYDLGEALKNVLSKDEYKTAIETIFIEGHTDNVPIENAEFHSNWELSTQRAINTWNLMRMDIPTLDGIRNMQGQPIFSCSGYAETRPITDDEYDEDSEEGRQANRRIDLRFAMMPPRDSAETNG
jgi:ompA/motB domain protein